LAIGLFLMLSIGVGVGTLSSRHDPVSSSSSTRVINITLITGRILAIGLFLMLGIGVGVGTLSSRHDPASSSNSSITRRGSDIGNGIRIGRVISTTPHITTTPYHYRPILPPPPILLPVCLNDMSYAYFSHVTCSLLFVNP